MQKRDLSECISRQPDCIGWRPECTVQQPECIALHWCLVLRQTDKTQRTIIGPLLGPLQNSERSGPLCE